MLRFCYPIPNFQKHSENDYDRSRYRKQNAVEISREKEKSLHEADRAGMIEEFRVDRELAMQEFKDQLQGAKTAQLKSWLCPTLLLPPTNSMTR